MSGRCTFLDELGRRCPATGNLEFEHVDGFALTHLHDEDRIRLMCRSHNQHAAEKIYGRAFMERARSLRASTCSGPGRGALGAVTRQLDLLGQPTPQAARKARGLRYPQTGSPLEPPNSSRSTHRAL